jgi:hypothetical protein
MKKLKLLLTLISILFITCFYSCNNSQDNSEELEGTAWESSSFKRVIDDYFVQGDKIVIVFKLNNCAKIYIKNFTIEGFWGVPQEYEAMYDYKGGKLTIEIDAGELPPEYNFLKTWTGKVLSETMTLNNVFGETMKFRQQ